MMKKSNKKGFTLVELIVVIAIMAILAAVLVPTITSKINDANESAAKSDCSAVANAIQSDIIAMTSGLQPAKEYSEVTITDGKVTAATDVVTTDKVAITVASDCVKVSSTNEKYEWYYLIDASGKITTSGLTD